jgi:malate dehydrogenase (oxaloacetate-decarboxylating)(NADP+)
MLAKMADRPLILALANPDPEISPEVAKATRPDAIIATGRSDYPNQVNNVLCFPFIFRGALDVGATTINEEMKFAAVHAIAALARAEQSDIVASAYGHQETRFGADFLIPRPFDPRLISVVAPAVAEAAMKSGVATRPIKDMPAYRSSMERFVYKSGNTMKPVFEAAAQTNQRVIFAEGEESRVLRAVQIAVDEKLARPVLVGRGDVVNAKIRDFGLRLEQGRDFDLIDLHDEALIKSAVEDHYQLTRRKGGSRERIDRAMHSNNTLLAATMLRLGRADGMLCGTHGDYSEHLECVSKAIGFGSGRRIFAAMNLLMLPQHTVFICDTYINADPTAEELADITILATDEMCRFGINPRVALLSHSSFGSSDVASARKMRATFDLVLAAKPDLEIEGEMRGDMALSKRILDAAFPDSRLHTEANLLIMPNLDAANITYNVLKTVAGEGVTVGPILLGAAKPVHILTSTSTVRGIVNMTALASVDASIKS